MIKVGIKDKLNMMGIDFQEISLGIFDQIGEFTAKKSRDPSTDLYKTAGCFFRPNYERGILIYYLIQKFNIKSYLEIGFGRGYSSICAAKSMVDAGIDGKIISIDPFIDKNHMEIISKIFPSTWMSKISIIPEFSQNILSKIDEKFDLIYIDGDHRYDAVKNDWLMCKDRFNKFLLFDDYHLPSRGIVPDIDCAKVIDQINDFNKELIIMDRRIFFDDRRFNDDQIDYGQVLLTNNFTT